MDIAQSIKKSREEQGLTQKALADKMGVTPVLISQYENGKRNPKIETLRKIADALGMSVTDLVGSDNMRIVLLSEEACSLEEELLLSRVALEKAKRQQTSDFKFTKSEKSFNKLLTSFEQLNSTGQQKAAEQVELLTKIPEYKKKDATPALNAAHDNGATPDQKKNADDIMENPDEWN